MKTITILLALLGCVLAQDLPRSGSYAEGFKWCFDCWDILGGPCEDDDGYCECTPDGSQCTYYSVNPDLARRVLYNADDFCNENPWYEDEMTRCECDDLYYPTVCW